MVGYAVIDFETTGLRPSWRDRVIEIGVVLVDPSGQITGEWNTLVNPGRDLGPQRIHGISAADVRHAPTFEDLAGTLTALLRGRVPVAHNLRFDWEFLDYEYTRMGARAPVDDGLGVCTMVEAPRFLPDAPRNLKGCCALAGVPLDNHHDALADAHAAAGLLRHYLAATRPESPWPSRVDMAARVEWPSLESGEAERVRRGVSAERDTHFLARLVDRLPRAADPAEADVYLALLDRVLVDRRISATAADSLVELAGRLGLSRADLDRLHRDYLAGLVSAAAGDLDEAGRHEIGLVADLLHVPSAEVDALEVGGVPGRPRFTLRPGDLIVFTGDMDALAGGREALQERARQASYVPYDNVTRKVRLVVAADPDTMSGKARKAREYGIPIVTAATFLAMLG
ncbi:hypothetical protein J5X84_23195 [Streptosporangiaceae bacterium NEAU-GS5]|nr:hypothetical protein [Streptosporangiaceae bacterium NEAU-GS5]